jgi:hypothetical protein
LQMWCDEESNLRQSNRSWVKWKRAWKESWNQNCKQLKWSTRWWHSYCQHSISYYEMAMSGRHN